MTNYKELEWKIVDEYIHKRLANSNQDLTVKCFFKIR